LGHSVQLLVATAQAVVIKFDAIISV